MARPTPGIAGPLRRTLVAVVAALAVLVALTGCGPGATIAGPGGETTTTAGATRDPSSGLPVIGEDQLPPEALDTLALIDAGGPFPYSEDGDTFFNREGLLPEADEGYYQEYTVETPGEDDRGARRIVTGDADTIIYYTPDHYQSFSRVRR